MTRLQQACLLAGVLWVGMHLWHGLTFLGRHPSPTLSVAAMVLCLVATVWAAAPLATGREDLDWSAATVLVVLGALVVVLVVPFLDAEGVRSYANWPAGGLGPLIAGLVMRHHLRHAVTLAGFTCAVIVGTVTWTGGLDPVWSISLCIPPLLWLGATYLVRRIFDRTTAAVGLYTTAEQHARSRAAVAAAREANATTRREGLERDVLPLLTELSHCAATVPGEVAAACGRLETQLRDDLRARRILDTPLRALLAASRDQDTQVSIIDDREEPTENPVTAAARETIATSLPYLTGARVTYRISPEDGLTIVAQGQPHVLAVTAQHLRKDGEEQLDVDGQLLYYRRSLRPQS